MHVFVILIERILSRAARFLLEAGRSACGGDCRETEERLVMELQLRQV
jgi:hypothetical protein